MVLIIYKCCLGILYLVLHFTCRDLYDTICDVIEIEKSYEDFLPAVYLKQRHNLYFPKFFKQNGSLI